MQYSGYMKGLKHVAESPVQYFLSLGNYVISLNDWLGEEVAFRFQGGRACTHCGRKVTKLYNSGYCYPCFTTLAECDLCIVKPHECHFDHGTCRDEEFGRTFCMAPHYVYLAFSNHVKVGLTSKTRGTARWIDQGAIRAVPIAELPTRQLAGELEFAISQHIPDKTDWRKMLTGKFEQIDLMETLAFVKTIVPDRFQPYMLTEDALFEFTYPQLEQLDKVKSLSFDKMDLIRGRLIGIKGQYVILDQGVINIKKHAGYEMVVSCEPKARDHGQVG